MEFKYKVFTLYTGLMIYTTLNLAYPKEYVYYMLLIYGMISLFWNLLYPFVICGCVICYVTDVWHHTNLQN